MSPEDMKFAVDFAAAMLAVKKAANAGEGVELNADLTKALLRGIDLIRPKKDQT